VTPVSSVKKNGIILAGTPHGSPVIASLKLEDKLKRIGNEGYIIVSARYKHKNIIVIAANKDAGVLYGAFNLLRLMQTHKNLSDLSLESSPKTKIRILNHWDMPDCRFGTGNRFPTVLTQDIRIMQGQMLQ
jgi:alpha-glucuronidase